MSSQFHIFLTCNQQCAVQSVAILASQTDILYFRVAVHHTDATVILLYTLLQYCVKVINNFTGFVIVISR